MTHQHKPMPWIILTAVIGLVAIALVARPTKQRFDQWQYERGRPQTTELPDIATVRPSAPPQTKQEPDSPKKIDAKPTIPAALNRNVPFTSQAPSGNWDEHHEQYCEEASTLMVGRFFHDRGITDSKDAESGLLELENWQMQHFGSFESTTAEQTATMIADVYGLDATVKQSVTSLAIKQILSDGGLVILPTAGQQLGNPYFKQPGPVYHMVVVKGFTKDDQFITNDPGTRHGADYVYKSATLLAAIGDYNNDDPANGAKVMIVVRPKG